MFRGQGGLPDRSSKVKAGLALALVAAFVSGCGLMLGPMFFVDVDGLADPSASPGSYQLVTSELQDGEDDLQFREFAQYTRRALDSQGFRAAGPGEAPEIVILLTYGISDPKETVHVSSSTRMESANVSSTTIGPEGLSSTQGTAQVPVTETESYSVVTHARFIELEAVDADRLRSGARRQRWTLSLESVGWSGDLRRVFPAMLAAGKGYIGQNTRGRERVIIRERDAKVAEIRGEPVAADER